MEYGLLVRRPIRWLQEVALVHVSHVESRYPQAEVIASGLCPEDNVVANYFKISPLQDVLSLLLCLALEQNDFALETREILGLFFFESFASLWVSELACI